MIVCGENCVDDKLWARKNLNKGYKSKKMYFLFSILKSQKIVNIR